MIDLRGFDPDGQPAYSVTLSLAEFPKAKHLWEDADYIRSHRIAKLIGVLYDERGEMHQEYERNYDRDGRYLGGTIKYADDRTIHANTSGLEPTTIPHGGFVFTVHYMQNTSQPKARPWFALCMVVYDQDLRVYPADFFRYQQRPASAIRQGVGGHTHRGVSGRSE
jgi:hypothetical protein